MNELLKTFFSPRQIDYEYISINSESIIVEFSLNVNLFSDCPENVKHGNEISLSFPEFVGLESIYEQLLEDQISHFEFKGIARNVETDSPVYFDVYILKNEENFTYLDGEIIILFDDKTEWMVREQKYSQIYKEYELSVSRLEQANNYTNQIIHAMNDILLITNSSGMITKINQATQNLLEYQEYELIDESIAYIFSDKHSKNTMDLSDFILEKMHHNSFEVYCKTKTGKEIIISFSCSIFSRSPFERQELLWIGRDITKQKQLEQQLHHQLEQNNLLTGMTQRIRQSLSLEQILKTTVREVRQLLKVNGVLFYQITPKNEGNIEANSFSLNLAKQFNNLPKEALVPPYFLSVLEEGIIISIDDLNQSFLSANLRDWWLELGIYSELIIPIITKTSSISSLSSSEKKLWGMLIACQLTQSRRWEKWEVHLLEQLATPIAVAIQQAELYEQLKIANLELEKMAMTDGLTLVANRRFFDKIISQEWNRLRREVGTLSLIICDIDYFKRYNDIYGHLAGDSCLKKVAQVLQEEVKRSGDLVARYGGEKFAILLPKTDLEGAILVSEMICSKVRSLQIPHEKSLVAPYVTISIGVASTIPEPPLMPKTLILRADQALYEAKKNGRDRVFVAAN
jgi:diguanylate cyclase (GGDEF)-like protein/PAS domain S-box-containing protein